MTSSEPGAPVEPAPTRWDLAGAVPTPGEDLVAVGGDLLPGTILSGYRAGLFPMGLEPGGHGPIGWWSPQQRGVFGPGDLHISRSLRRSLGRFTVSRDTDFDAVIAGCADPSRPGAWITAETIDAYRELHRLRWAHSIEVRADGVLVGGLYGLRIGRLFAAESMFHRSTDASKAALAALVAFLDLTGPDWLIDVQWSTPHLASLGAREWPRDTYRAEVSRLARGAASWTSVQAGGLPESPVGDLRQFPLRELVDSARPCGPRGGSTR